MLAVSMLIIWTLLVSVRAVAMLLIPLRIVAMLLVRRGVVAMLTVSLLVMSRGPAVMLAILTLLITRSPSTIIMLVATLVAMLAIGARLVTMAVLRSVVRCLGLWRAAIHSRRTSVLVSTPIVLISTWIPRIIGSRMGFSRTTLVIAWVRATHLPISTTWLVMTRWTSGVRHVLVSSWATHVARKATCHICMSIRPSEEAARGHRIP